MPTPIELPPVPPSDPNRLILYELEDELGRLADLTGEDWEWTIIRAESGTAVEMARWAVDGVDALSEGNRHPRDGEDFPAFVFFALCAEARSVNDSERWQIARAQWEAYDRLGAIASRLMAFDFVSDSTRRICSGMGGRSSGDLWLNFVAGLSRQPNPPVNPARRVWHVESSTGIVALDAGQLRNDFARVACSTRSDAFRSSPPEDYLCFVLPSFLKSSIRVCRWLVETLLCGDSDARLPDSAEQKTTRRDSTQRTCDDTSPPCFLDGDFISDAKLLWRFCWEVESVLGHSLEFVKRYGKAPRLSKDRWAASQQAKQKLNQIQREVERIAGLADAVFDLPNAIELLDAIRIANAATMKPIRVGDSTFATAHEAVIGFAELLQDIWARIEGVSDRKQLIDLWHRLEAIGSLQVEGELAIEKTRTEVWLDNQYGSESANSQRKTDADVESDASPVGKKKRTKRRQGKPSHQDDPKIAFLEQRFQAAFTSTGSVKAASRECGISEAEGKRIRARLKMRHIREQEKKERQRRSSE